MGLGVSHAIVHCSEQYILARKSSGEWTVEVPVILANHPDLEPVAKRFGVEFRAFKITKENRDEVEEEQLTLLRSLRTDFVVLARYMQILSGSYRRIRAASSTSTMRSFPRFPGRARTTQPAPGA